MQGEGLQKGATRHKDLANLLTLPRSLIFLVPIKGSVPTGNALEAERLNQKRIEDFPVT